MALGRGAAKQRKEGVKTVCVQKSQDWQGSSSSNCKAFRSSSLFIYSKFLSPIFSSGAQRDEGLELPNFALIDHLTLDSQIFWKNDFTRISKIFFVDIWLWTPTLNYFLHLGDDEQMDYCNEFLLCREPPEKRILLGTLLMIISCLSLSPPNAKPLALLLMLDGQAF